MLFPDKMSRHFFIKHLKKRNFLMEHPPLRIAVKVKKHNPNTTNSPQGINTSGTRADCPREPNDERTYQHTEAAAGFVIYNARSAGFERLALQI